ncbi:MAG: tyrosine-type recombinase/integrase, partial [Candidatus Marinimicrobia bacterium]|nr:tyrosine-type recombinase/integrase [Candidatus Neomarinimicrobiota bacterium]
MELIPQVIEKQELDIPQALQQAEALFNVMDISENTKEDYLRRLPVFLEFIKSNGLNINTYITFKKYLATLPYYSISTKNKYLATARIFLKELNRIGKLPQDITQNIKSFKQSHKHKKDGINSEEMDKIMTAVAKMPEDKTSIRLKAILSLLALQGLRQVEIVRLDVNDIDLVSKSANVLGKGRDDKEQINLHPETVKALKE